MAAGTLVSRILGFVKTILLTVAIGSLSTVGDVFETANTLPNLIYVLVAGGVFNAVLVPQIIKAAKAQDGGARYISKLVTLTVTAIGLITLITVACAWPIISIMGSGWSPEQRQLGFIFSLWCLPQIFFYGLYTVIGQVLNAKDAFGAYMWSPVLNNVITILSLILFIFLFGAQTPQPQPDSHRRQLDQRTDPRARRLLHLRRHHAGTRPVHPPYASSACASSPTSHGEASACAQPPSSPPGPSPPVSSPTSHSST